MRDASIINQFSELQRQQNAIAYHMQLGFSGEALFDETMKKLLIKKGLITEDEFKAELGETIKEINAREAEAAAKAAEAEKKTLVTPSPAEVAKVEETKAE